MAFRDSQLHLYDFLDFHYSRMNFPDFYDLHDSHMDFQYFHDFLNSQMDFSKNSMIFVILVLISLIFFDFHGSPMDF